MTLLDLFTAVGNSSTGNAIRDSRWLFPAIESCHLLGLAVIGGSILIVNLRLLGLGLTKTPARELARDIRPFYLGSLAVMLISGFLLFSSEATRCYANAAFWLKMGSLALALLFTSTVWKKATQNEAASPITMKLAAIISLLLWSGVGIGGRWIGLI
jgi:hypothetical protein